MDSQSRCFLDCNTPVCQRIISLVFGLVSYPRFHHMPAHSEIHRPATNPWHLLLCRSFPAANHSATRWILSAGSVVAPLPASHSQPRPAAEPARNIPVMHNWARLLMTHSQPLSSHPTRRCVGRIPASLPLACLHTCAADTAGWRNLAYNSFVHAMAMGIRGQTAPVKLDRFRMNAIAACLQAMQQAGCRFCALIRDSSRVATGLMQAPGSFISMQPGWTLRDWGLDTPSISK
ncbi:hypothetical protein F4780DRAFT_91148 [Xylariomycetidae sp. FL0641]|nr:hypothetical protein F4780DRAFT_91148 [Xylariomycetidae sp. FL0641]